MNWVMWVFLGVLLVGCGRGTIGQPQDHGVFEPYFQAFEEASKTHGRPTTGDSSLTIEFGNVSGEDAVGSCESSPVSFKVVIDRNYWMGIDDDTKKVLIFHELGHCLLGLQHDNSFVQQTIPQTRREIPIPASLMYPNIFGGGLFKDYESYYLDQLF